MYIFRLNVAMNNLLQVDVADGASHLQRNLQPPCEVARAPLLDGIPQALAIQKFHHHEGTPVFLAEIVNCNDVFVRDAGSQAGFQQEFLLGFRIASRRFT